MLVILCVQHVLMLDRMFHCFWFLPNQMDIIPGPDGRFGFTIVGDCPLLVEDCSPCSPAGRAGLRAGDYVMEVNGIPVRQHETAAALIKASQGRTLRLGVLCLGPRQKQRISVGDSQSGGEHVRLDRKHKALEFNSKVLFNAQLTGRHLAVFFCEVIIKP